MKNKKRIIKLAKIVFGLVISIFVIRCLLFSFFIGKSGYNEDISHSKSTGVFVKEYKIKDNQIRISDRLVLPVGEIWAEHPWAQGGCTNPVVTGEHNEYSNYWMYIEMPDSTKYKNINEFWYLFDRKIAILTEEGEVFSIRGIGDKQLLFCSFKNLSLKVEKLTIIERAGPPGLDTIPQLWQNPRIIGTIDLIATP